jgi:serine/threonine protein kinase
MLNALAVRKHPHLVKLLATYKFKSHYHLVFPFANTNLRGYWEDTGLPRWNQETYAWFLGQLRGLTSGLNAIHNFRGALAYGKEPAHQGLTIPVGEYLTVEPAEERFGRHGDIKPENILWSNEFGTGKDGILQIADLGLGRFHGVDSRSVIDARFLSCSPTYAPPEVVLKLPVSRAYDIWSMGCVFLEFVTWLLEGDSVLKDFSSARANTGLDGVNDDTFYTLVRHAGEGETAVVRDGVLSWIDRFRHNARCSRMVHELLDLIQTRMLVVDSKQRIRSEVLDAELRAMGIKSKANLAYLMGSNAPVRDAGAGVKLPLGPSTRYAPRSMLDMDESSMQGIESQPMNNLMTPTIILSGEDGLSRATTTSAPSSRTPFPM